jgi:hypothetical protein
LQSGRNQWGLYKTELIKPRKPWRTIEEVELATADEILERLRISTADSWRRTLDDEPGPDSEPPPVVDPTEEK